MRIPFRTSVLIGLVGIFVVNCWAQVPSHKQVNNRGKLREMFDLVLDRDHSGFVTYDEMVAAIAELEPDQDPSPVGDFIKAIDKDLDGMLSWHEFAQRFSKLDDANRYVDKNTPEQVHLQLTTDPSTVIVIWVTFASTSASIVQFGLSETDLDSRLSGEEYTYDAGELGWDGYLHKVALTGLSPRTKYYYRVGDGTSWSPTFFFTSAPIPGTGGNYNYLVYGDMGTFMPFGMFVTERIVETHKVQQYDMTLHLGDVSYAGTGSTREWEIVWDIFYRQIEPIAAYYPYMITVGNHEKYYNFTAHNARAQMPGRESGGYGNFYFSFDYGLVHFASLCSEEYAAPYQIGSAQYEWLRQDLAKAVANRGRVPWIVVSAHRPFYDSSDALYTEENFRAIIEPILVEFKVDLFLVGHVHVYERTHALANYMVTDYPDANQVYHNPSAPIQVTIGTAGALVSDRWNTKPDWSAVRYRSYGFSDFLVYNSTHLKFTFRSRQGGPDWPEGGGIEGVSDVFWIVKN